MNGRKEIVITKYRERPILLYMMDDRPYDLLVGESRPQETLEVGDIYVGRVQNIVQNIHAAFIEVKKGSVCYLPMSEFGGRKVCVGDELVVQVKKAAVKTKQAVVTLDIGLVGTYCVVTAKNGTKGISKKISDEEIRAGLQELLNEYKEEMYGIVLRTNAAEGEADQVREECTRLAAELHDMMEHSQYKTCFSRLRKAEPFYMSYIRSCHGEDYERIITDDKSVYDDLQERAVDKVVFYEDTSYPLEKLLGIGTKIEKALAKRVWLKSGGNLVIEPTEALTVIDVNTGKAIDGKRKKETTFFKINCEAAKEAARQMRLRSMSGIILIDFIDMKEKEHQLELMELLRQEFRKDKTKTTLVDITKLGLVEVTRMKKNPPLWEIFKSPLDTAAE